MYKLSLLHKRRVWWGRFAKVVMYCSIISLFAWIWVSDYFPPEFEKPVTLATIILMCASSLVVGIPFTKHRESGTITLNDDDFQLEIFSKLTSYKISELHEIEVYIQGYWGQEYFAIRNILPVEDGTSNFISFKYREQKIKLEILLETKEDLAILKKYVRKYQDQVSIKITESRSHVN